MNSGSSNTIVERVFGWLRGFITSKGVDRRDASPPGSGRQELPDLDDSESDYQYTGDAGGANRPPDQPGTGGPASRAAEHDSPLRSSLDDASGDAGVDDASYPVGTDDVSSLHDAIGGEDARADDDTDGIIDTRRDTDVASRRPEVPQPDNVPETDHDEPGVSEQDELSAFKGAQTDEFSSGGYTPKPVDQEDVQAAARGAPTSVPDAESPDNIDHQHQMGGSGDIGSVNANVPEVREYNYGLGDLGAGHSGTHSTEAEPSGDPDDTQAAARDDSTSHEPDRPAPGDSGKRGVSRTEIESTAAGDAFVQGDEAVTAPGQSDPGAFTEPEIGTVEPSRSATGNDEDNDRQDALGTTLEHDATEADPFDSDESNLAGQEELSILDDDSGDRDTGFEGGTSAQAVTGIPDATSADQATRDSYADFPDEPEPEATADSGLDDFAGSDYPSDRRIDPLAGDDAFDATEPDPAGDAGSSAGDLESEDDEVLMISQLDAEDDTGGDAGLTGRTIDQDTIGTSDEHVGGESPAFVDNLQANDAPAPARDIGDADSGETDTRAARAQTGGDVPAGAVAGDGTTATPEGYPIKGNASSKIYHLPEYPSYKGTKPDFCFATEGDAIAAGFRAPGRRNRGRGRKR